jgi:hypothetical protein
VQAVRLANKPLAWTAWKTQIPPTTGWLNNFQIILRNADALSLIQCGDNNRYATPEDAIQQAKPTRFEIAPGVMAIFCILDSFTDDAGGLTLELRTAPSDRAQL